MLRIGECFAAQERPGDARTFYEAVVATYPRTDAAKEAARKLGR
jgi:TolA-binding protein